MLLISQNGNSAFNFDHVYDVSRYGTSIYATVDYDGEGKPLEMRIGEYETDERAEAVFRDLVDALDLAMVEPIGTVRIAKV